MKKYLHGKALAKVIYDSHSSTPIEEDRELVARRMEGVLEAIAASPLLRDELIAAGLSPTMVEHGIKHHISLLREPCES